MSLLLFLSGAFLLTFILGKLLERKHIPWIFSSLLIGLALAVKNPFVDITSSPSFIFMAQLGMFFLLFIIGFELNSARIIRQGKFIAKVSFAILITETVLGTLFIHAYFQVSWLIAAVVASSFATVGEALLLPILDEFNLVRTKLGQTILGVGILDDIVEVLTIIVVSVVIGRLSGHAHGNIWLNLFILFALFAVVYIFMRFHQHIHVFKYRNITSSFLFILFFIFLFTGVGGIVESAALGALLAGIALRNVVPENKLKIIDSEIRTISYGFFAPIFFLWVGINTDVAYVLDFFPYVLIVIAITSIGKIVPAYIAAKKQLGKKKSLILGTSLMVKLSTSIVVLKLLLLNELISIELYSILIASTVFFSFLVPILLSALLKKWEIGFIKVKE